MRIVWLLCCCVWSTALLAGTVSGVVLTADQRKPVHLASVFFSNTSVGTVTDSAGRFTIYNAPSGKYDLVVSYVGYETAVQTIETDKQTSPLTVYLKLKPKELDNVVIEPYDKENWAKWGRFFTERFLGLTANSSHCSIVNHKAIQFRYYKKTKRLIAFSNEPLQIDNHALGYRIKYQLENFEYNFSSSMQFYQGYPLFEEMPAKEGSKKQRNWEANRAAAYEGSVMHFMRSLYRNQLTENGFEIRYLKKVPNTEKQRMKEQLRQQAQSGQVTLRLGTQPNDSSDYRSKVMSQPDMMDVLNPNLVPADSIAFAIDKYTAGLYFSDYLHVMYLHKAEPVEYVQVQRRSKADNKLVSQIQLMQQEVLSIAANGSFYAPNNLLLLGYWAFSENMSGMLPFDYKPTVINKK